VIRKVLKFVGIALLCVIVVAVSSALLYRKYLQHKVSEARAITSANGIDSLEAVQIGGIQQWIEVRGQDVNNPILLFIHGGPGIAFIPMASAFQTPWEKTFTVVQWDQRGAGKTYASNDRELQRRTMNLQQMEQDTLDVANYLRNRFHREKIFVVGHSWGSILGLWLAHEHPEAVAAFVGTGQAVNMQQNEDTAYRDALQKARESHNEQAIKELEGIAPYPGATFEFQKSQVARRWEQELLSPPSGPQSFTDMRRILTTLISAPEYSIGDDVGFIRATGFSIQTMLSELMKINLTPLGYDFREPIFFFEGRRDPYCRPAPIFEYMQKIDAPTKDFVWFENSGHFPFFEEKEKFATELAGHLLPLVSQH
jgi:proline iminopeptidase